MESGIPRAMAGVALVFAVAASACGGGDVPAAPPSPSTPRGSGSPGPGPAAAPPELQTFDFGGDFELMDQAGASFRLSGRRDRTHLLFFGYASCPDFCPVTLSLLTRVQERLAGQGYSSPAFTTLFVSIDPERDTPERLTDYLGYFALDAIGLTGSQEQIDEVVRQYAAMVQPTPESTDERPLLAHSTYVYLIDGAGTVRYTFRHDDSAEFIASGVAQLLGNTATSGDR